VKPTNAKKRWPGIVLAVLFILVGLASVITGRGGQKFGYPRGDHVRVGGALVMLTGVAALYAGLRK
jgi:hypothetical protein